MPTPTRYTLIGGGLGGALLATYLGRAGHSVDLYERRPDPTAGNLIGGRSINLAISVRGLHALEQVGLAGEILKIAIPMRGRMIHARAGELHYQPYDADPTRCINSVSRAGLNTLTLESAKRCPGVRVSFNHKCLDVDLDTAAAEILNTETSATIRTTADALIGIDGAFSTVRRAMPRLDRFNYEQCYLAHGYKELTIPPGPDGKHAIEKNALHIWPRKSFMMIALPNPDGSFTCTLFYAFEGPQSFATLRTDDDIRRFFNDQFPDALPLMPTLIDDYRAHPTGSMATIRCAPWTVGDKIALVGDAAHAVVPFYGQGANASFEDVFILDECLREFPDDRTRAFQRYEERRKPSADAIANLALANFIEMRDKTGSTTFLWYKKLDRALHKWIPRIYTPLYTMISFTRTPYADAVRRSRRQDRALIILAALLLTLILWPIVALGFSAGRPQALSIAAGIAYIAATLVTSRASAENRNLRRIGVRE